MENQAANRKRQVIATLAVLIVIVVIVAAVTLSSKQHNHSAAPAASTSVTTGSDAKTSTPSASSSSAKSSTSSTATASNASGYENGSYSAEGEYVSPGGNEAITIKVTLKDGVITDTSATSGATDSEAEEYQSQFISGYKSLVVGKSIDSVRLSRVSGSSLTSQGFNDAIDQIKSDAKTS